MPPDMPPETPNSKPPIDSHSNTEARLGDRGAASGRNIEQDRAIGQDDPQEAGSRMGGERGRASDIGTPDIGTDAKQTREAERAKQR